MNDSKKGFVHNVRQSVLTTLVLLLICGFLFPVVLTGLSAVMFPHQAGGQPADHCRRHCRGRPECWAGFYAALFHEGPPFGLSVQHVL